MNIEKDSHSMNNPTNTELLNYIRHLLAQARQQVATTVNTAMVQTIGDWAVDC